MDRRTAAFKLACLLGPLAACFLSLFAWGEPLRTKADHYWMRRIYTEHRRIGFDIRVRKKSELHESTAEKLGRFLDETLSEFGTVLGLKDPRTAQPPLRILLLEMKDHLKPHGLDPSPARDHEGGRFAAKRGEIVLLAGEGSHHQEADARVLRHHMTHLLLHRSEPNAEWSPWLEEGLAEYLEDFPPGPRPSAEPLPPLSRILGSSEWELRSPSAESLRQGARLLIAFLLERYLDRFSAFAREDRRPGPVTPETFFSKVGPIEEIETEWRAWVARLK